MRILEVARQFYPKTGGIESCVLNLSKRLVARDHRVEVVTLNRDLHNGQRLDSPPQSDSIKIHRVSYLGSRRYPIAPSWLGLINDFDVVHVHAIDFFLDSAALGKALGFHRKPIIVTTHGGIFHTDAWLPVKNFYWRHVLSRSLRAVESVVAVSDRDASLFRSIVQPDRLVTIPNGIDPAFASAQAVRVRGRVVCFGRVTDAKGVDKILDLLALFARDVKNLELLIVGPAEQGVVEALRQKAESLAGLFNIRILGELPIEELSTLVASAHLLISAARHEGFGITTVEALSAGVPVLVTHTGIHDQIVRPGINGWFWSGLPDEGAATTLRQALLLPDARLDEMKVAARKSAAPFDWNLATEKYEHVFESAHRKSVG
jgi:alpha-1,3-mannosyltransferase